MLRSSRKNSPTTSNGLLPHYYSQEPNGIPSNPSVQFPSLPRRRPIKAPSSSPSKSWRPKSRIMSSCTCCLVYAFFIMVMFVFARHGDHPQAHPTIKSIHQAMARTLAEVPKFTFDQFGDITDHGQRHREVAPLLAPRPPRQGVYDVAVVGTGPAGLTASLFAARAGLSVLVVGSDAGSTLSEAYQLENFPSFVGNGHNVNVRGPQWLEQTKLQAAQWGATFATSGLLVDKMHVQQHQEQEIQSTIFTLEIGGPTKAFKVHSRSIIVATGATGRRLGLPKEDLLWGKSVHNCAICDGSLYVDKVVVVVGGGDAAVDGALLLSRYAREVILVHRRTQLRATNQRNIELLKTTPNIRVEVPFTVQTLETFQAVGHLGQAQQELLGAVDLVDVETSDTQRIACDGVFEFIGATPNTQWLQQTIPGPKLDEGGFLIRSNPTLETQTATTLDGIFAAGEVADQVYRQAITAASEGAQAAMDAERWLRNQPFPAALLAAKQHPPSPPIPLQDIFMPHDEKVQPEPRQLQTLPTAQKRTGANVAPCEDLTRQACITQLVLQYPVVVFSKPWCPYCRKALEALSAEGLSEGNPNLHVVDLSQYADKTRQIQATLQAMTGRFTVPNVFVGGASIGGGDETGRFHQEGTLRVYLLHAKAISPEGLEAKEDSDRPSCDDLTQERCVSFLVNKYPVVMFAKEGCPHCSRALEALALEGVPEGSTNLHIVNLTPMANKEQIQDQLERMTGRRTVPNVFLGGSTIGGGSEVVQLQRNGDLRTMLKKVHAIQ